MLCHQYDTPTFKIKELLLLVIYSAYKNAFSFLLMANAASP